MATKRTAIVLEKLAEETGELASMVTELCDNRETRRDGAKVTRWSRRFGASGKTTCASAPRIRLA